MNETLTTQITAFVQSVVDGTWTVDGSILQLDERTGSTVPFGIELRDDGTLLVDDEVARLRDARVECADAELQTRLTAALGGTAWFVVQQAGNIPVRLKIGLCDSGRFHLEATSSSTGTWSVQVANGVATLTLARDGGGTRDFVAAFDPSGGPTVDGTAPIDDESLVSAACQS